jgi:hypothetical protein
MVNPIDRDVTIVDEQRDCRPAGRAGRNRSP